MITAETSVRYRKKPIEIEARRFDLAADYDEACSVIDWCGGTATDEGCEIGTVEGVMLARSGDWIIKGVAGEFYPCRADIFALTYEAAGDAPQPDGERPPCGSGPLERGYMPGSTGMPVSCSDDWHDLEACDV